MKTYKQLASTIQARLNCETSGNAEWFDRHSEVIENIVRETMPSGSGFDAGTKIDFDASTSNNLVFNTEFHHMDDNGSYTKWTTHKVIVTPDLAFDFAVKITGTDYRQIKEYIHQCFDIGLSQDIVVNADNSITSVTA